jgi:hypothetical protein
MKFFHLGRDRDDRNKVCLDTTPFEIYEISQRMKSTRLCDMKLSARGQ